MVSVCRRLMPFLFGCVFLTLVPEPGAAADVLVSADTLVRGFDRQAENGKTLSAVPLYQYLRLDYGSLKASGLSLHVNGWGRVNAGENYNSGTSAGELLHAYLQYQSPCRSTLVRAGRQFVFEGVTRDNIDGVYAKTELDSGIVASVYAGSPVTLGEINGRGGDLLFGGKVAHSRPGLYDLGVSYKRMADNGQRSEETVGSDLMLSLPGSVSLLGRSSYNLASNGWKEHSYELRLPLNPLTLQPFYQHFRYADYFSNRSGSANPFRFLQGSGNSLTVAGVETYWYPSDRQEYVLRVKNYDYASRFSNSQLYSLLAIWKFRILSEVGAEFGRMQGNDRENSYYLGRGYFYWDTKPGFLTGDVMYVHYDKALYKKDSSLFASVGGGTRLYNDALSIKLTLDYSSDPYLDSDYRWMLKVSYLFDRTLTAEPRRN